MPLDAVIGYHLKAGVYQQKNYIVFILVMMKNKRLLTMQERQKEY